MRVLMSHTGESGPVDDDEALARAYAVQPTSDGLWFRVNMVSTVDGSAQGDDGRSGGINNAADHRVFTALRSYADVLVVGAGTARIEEYGAAGVPLVVVSRTGVVPQTLRGLEAGRVVLATVENAEGIAEARELLGVDNVWVLGAYTVDLGSLRGELARRGFRQVLCEGGPHLLHALLVAEAVDELCLSVVPRLVSGEHKRIVEGQPADVDLELMALLEENGTVLARYRVVR